MHEAVSDILNDRARQAHGINLTLVVSIAAHVLLLALLVVMPPEWRSSQPEAKRPEMTISLGGAPGPADTGMTQMSGRSVQTVAPPEPKSYVSVPPMAKVPEMVVPDRTAKLKPPTTKPVDKPAEKSSSRRPTSGPEARTGAARADTGAAPVPFGGLATSGGGLTGGATLDVKDFCCPGYIQTMVQVIRSNWKPNQGAAGTAIVRFVILRDGRLANVEVEKPSGNALLDLESRRAVLMTRQLPPLPAQFTQPTLTVHLQFDYQR